MYVEIGGVVAKRWRRRPSAMASTASSGELEMTAQSAGALTVKLNVPLRSGWSKQG